MIVIIHNNPKMVSDGDTGRRFVLTEPMDCTIEGCKRIKSVQVPAGFDHDFASIPRALTIFIPKLGRYNRPAILHDYLYRMAPVDKETADLIFKAAMEYTGVSRGRRGLISWAVRHFGRRAWERYRRIDQLSGGT
jgi:hypothetical protein